jgi:transcriptional regulator with XRE-family HTH domain
MATTKPRKTRSASEVSPELGKTIQRLRKAYNMSLGDLSEQSGVAKSIISQIERNETNPTLSTVYRLSQALDTTIEEVLKSDKADAFIEFQARAAVPLLESEDGLCRLAIAGPLNLVDHLQWYDFHAKPGGVLESEPHPPGTIEHLYMVSGEVEVSVEGDTRRVKAGEALAISRRPAAQDRQCRQRSGPCQHGAGSAATLNTSAPRHVPGGGTRQGARGHAGTGFRPWPGMKSGLSGADSP